MRITTRKMSTPIQEELDNNIKVRSGMVKVSDGKTRPTPMRLQLSMELLKLQKEEVTPPNQNNKPSPSDSRVRIVGITRQKVGGLGLSIKGGSEHKLPILVSRIFKDQAADQTGQLFVGDAIIKVNGELITHCQHDEAVNILRNAGDIVMLTVKHYRAATPFLQKARIRNLSPSLMIRQTFSNTPSPVKRFSRSAGDDDVQTDDNFSSVDQISYEDLINIDCDYSVYSDSTLAEEDCRSDDGDDNFEIYYEKQWYYGKVFY